MLWGDLVWVLPVSGQNRSLIFMNLLPPVGPTQTTREPRRTGSGVASGFQATRAPPWACFIPAEASTTSSQLGSRQVFSLAMFTKPLILITVK